MYAWSPLSRRVNGTIVHLPPVQRDQVYRRLAESVAPGGTLLVVGHHHSDLQTSVPRCGHHDLFFTSGDIAVMLDPEEWDILVSEARERGMSSSSAPQKSLSAQA